MQLDPGYPNSHAGLAWVYASCIDDSYRDGKQALESATTACELTQWKEWSSLATLAASHAELGDFGEAVRWQNKALEIAPDKEKTKMTERLDLYKSGKPYRYDPDAAAS